MRVIAGTLGGRILRGPQGDSTRPITDRVKTNLFNILARRLAGAIVADCFCGTGSLGIEALSRGAARATFVDLDGSAVRLLRENLEALGLTDRARIVRQDVLRRGLPGIGIRHQALGIRAKGEVIGDQESSSPCPRVPVPVSLCPSSPGPYSLVFLDPPYHLTETAAGRLWLKLDEAMAAGQLSRDVVIVWRYEMGLELAVPADLSNRLRAFDCRIYGSQSLLFIERVF